MEYWSNWDLERARDSHAGEWDALSVPEQEAMLFCTVLGQLPLHIRPQDVFAGWYGFETEAELVKSLYTVPAAPRAPLEQGSPAWWLQQQGCNVGGYDRVHHELDYRTVLARGIDSYLVQVEEELHKPDNTPEKNDLLRGMKLALGAAQQLAGGFAQLAQQLASAAETPEEKARLQRMADACRKVPMQPPQDFYEALQAAWILRSLCGISSGSCVSVSFGSFDQYMYPYYLVSKEKGVTDDEITAMLLQFYRMLDTYDGNDCAVSVGGVDENGNDATNALSWLMVRAEKNSRLRAPLFVARINKNTPPEFLRELVSKELFEMGQPSFYSEESCLAAVKARGVSEQEAKRYQISTCMNLSLPHGEAAHGWGTVLNAHLPLELALNGGRPISGELPVPFRTQPRAGYETAEQLWAQYRAYEKEIFDWITDWNEENIPKQAKLTPNPWLSALTEDCIRRGRERWDGGALYHNIITEVFAMADTADAFTAIETLVFRQKKYTPEQLVAAAKANYQGCETLRRDLLSCGKYGMGDEAADANLRRLGDLHADICEARRAENRRYLPSLHTLWSDVPWGGDRPAFFSGRLAGEPVAKNAGPAAAARKGGPTNMVLSAGRLDQTRFNGGQALDVHIGVRNLNTTANRDKIAALIRTYFELGGLQIQVNGLSVETLKKAYADPAAYPDFIVRIGGHSRYFNEFDNNMKLKFIERFEAEEGAFA